MASNIDAPSNATTTSFRVATFNVMFTRDSYDRENDLVARLKEVIDESTLPLVIMLQEVGWSLATLLCLRLRHSHKTSEVFRDVIRRNTHGLLILVPREWNVTWTYIPFQESFMARGLAIADIPHMHCRFIASHLESMQTAQFSRIRHSQLFELYNAIKTHSNVIVGIDTNIATNLPSLPADIVDVWSDQPTETTWHGERFFGYKSDRRFDRILVKTASLNERDIRRYPSLSDHDLLLGTFTT